MIKASESKPQLKLPELLEVARTQQKETTKCQVIERGNRRDSVALANQTNTIEPTNTIILNTDPIEQYNSITNEAQKFHQFEEAFSETNAQYSNIDYPKLSKARAKVNGWSELKNELFTIGPETKVKPLAKNIFKKSYAFHENFFQRYFPKLLAVANNIGQEIFKTIQMNTNCKVVCAIKSSTDEDIVKLLEELLNQKNIDHKDYHIVLHLNSPQGALPEQKVKQKLNEIEKFKQKIKDSNPDFSISTIVTRLPESKLNFGYLQTLMQEAIFSWANLSKREEDFTICYLDTDIKKLNPNYLANNHKRIKSGIYSNTNNDLFDLHGSTIKNINLYLANQISTLAKTYLPVLNEHTAIFEDWQNKRIGFNKIGSPWQLRGLLGGLSSISASVLAASCANVSGILKGADAATSNLLNCTPESWHYNNYNFLSRYDKDTEAYFDNDALIRAFLKKQPLSSPYNVSYKGANTKLNDVPDCHIVDQEFLANELRHNTHMMRMILEEMKETCQAINEIIESEKINTLPEDSQDICRTIKKSYLQGLQDLQSFSKIVQEKLGLNFKPLQSELTRINIKESIRDIRCQYVISREIKNYFNKKPDLISDKDYQVNKLKSIAFEQIKKKEANLNPFSEAGNTALVAAVKSFLREGINSLITQ